MTLPAAQAGRWRDDRWRDDRWRDGIAAALVVTFEAPTSWAIGLVGFLAGGGLVLVAWPILALPTPTGLQNALGGPVSSLAFGSPSPTLLLVIAGLAAAGPAGLLGGIVVGAWAERAGIVAALAVARDEGLDGSTRFEGAPGVLRIALLRLLSLLPVAIALALAWPSIYAATYRELLSPGDLAVPVAMRVVRSIPGVLAGVLAVWLVADAAAAFAVRHLVLDRRRVPIALLLGWSDIIRRPLRALATALVALVWLAIPAALVLAAAAVGWQGAREALVSGQDTVGVLIPVLLWVAAWLAALVIAGAGAAFRSAAFTFEVRHRALRARV